MRTSLGESAYLHNIHKVCRTLQSDVRHQRVDAAGARGARGAGGGGAAGARGGRGHGGRLRAAAAPARRRRHGAEHASDADAGGSAWRACGILL